MPTRRFSSEELYSLRNDISIDAVIKNALHIPSRISEGCFRFLCPLCNEFNTAVNPATNLARCFYCKRNFNTIDLVMAVTQSDFVDSVRYLREYQRNSLNQIQPTGSIAKTREKGLDHIGSVLKAIAIPSAPLPPSCEPEEKLYHLILMLENKLERLAQRIEEIAKSSS
jgi:DNA primase